MPEVSPEDAASPLPDAASVPRSPGQLARFAPGYQALRQRVLREEPTCAICGNPSSEVDHALALAEGGTSSRGNMRALCGACHDLKSRLEQRLRGAARRAEVARRAVAQDVLRSARDPFESLLADLVRDLVCAQHDHCEMAPQGGRRCRRPVVALYGTWRELSDAPMLGPLDELPLDDARFAAIRAVVAEATDRERYRASCGLHMSRSHPPLIGICLEDVLVALTSEWERAGNIMKRAEVRARTRRPPGVHHWQLKSGQGGQASSGPSLLEQLAAAGRAERDPPIGERNPGRNHRWRATPDASSRAAVAHHPSPS